jgi:hypothetical protein
MGDRPLCEECARLNAEFSAQQLHHLAGALQSGTTGENTEQADAERADVDASQTDKHN